MELKMIEKNKIIPATWQPRETFPKEEINELTQSIKGMGLIQPIVVRKHGDNYQIIAGERRWRAINNNGSEKVPCVIREDDDVDAKVTSLLENWQRQPVKTVENERFIVNLYQDGMKSGKWKSVNDMSKKTGIPQITLNRILLASKDREKLSPGTNISWRDIDRTRTLKDSPETRKKLLEKHSEGEINALELENTAKKLSQFPEPEQQQEELERMFERKKFAEEEQELDYQKDVEISQKIREPEQIVEGDPSEIRFNTIKNKCEEILWLTPAKINIIENQKFRRDTIDFLKKTENHIRKLLITIGEYDVVEDEEY